ncbi:hypothetical protein ZIOFF_054231 [Zingiber officinale]|uniref:Uncharacterized protein n=1 Tax=Zingiber officinale TaxID=94328 RepID=A0A8J5FJS0_ZINOF|nr:hypothetical protein ZIOFF_054231 [Zingiber officinale]
MNCPRLCVPPLDRKRRRRKRLLPRRRSKLRSLRLRPRWLRPPMISILGNHLAHHFLVETGVRSSVMELMNLFTFVLLKSWRCQEARQRASVEVPSSSHIRSSSSSHLVRIDPRHKPVLRERLFFGALAAAFAHGAYLVYPLVATMNDVCIDLGVLCFFFCL